MRELADPAFKALLMALKEGALYLAGGELLILNDAGAFIDLADKPLLDSPGQPFLPDEPGQVPFEEANIPLVQRVLDALTLYARPCQAQSGRTAIWQSARPHGDSHA